MNEDGSMARLPDLLKFKDEHNLLICSIEDLIAYRRKQEKLVEREQTIFMPTDFGDFDLYLYRSKVDNGHHSPWSKGRFPPTNPRSCACIASA